ncbi:CTP synthase [Candidatus Dependentiae bacterium]|nr:CTP synthase [Candidatus Dependentiae bacterium]
MIEVRDRRKIKFIVVTGGVCSSLGKGVLVSSLGVLLQGAGHRVSVIKCDPYLNVDPGTMSPLEHGEVFVTADGAETDLDLGHYERTLEIQLSRDSSVSAGQIFARVLGRERQGEYLGRCIQLVPHVVDVIKEHILQFAINSNADIVLIEIGGTVGDIEGMVFLEALRQLKFDMGPHNLLHAHLSYVPFLSWTGEIKTKPTQHSVQHLKNTGLVPDALFLRTDQAIDPKARAKVALMCGVPPACVFEVLTVRPLFKLFFMLEQQGLVTAITNFFEGKSVDKKADLRKWDNLLTRFASANNKVTIALVTKYAGNNDPYLSVIEAVKTAVYHEQLVPEIVIVNAEKLEANDEETWLLLKGAAGIVVPGGFDQRGAEGKILALRYARENNIPCLGLCLGFQLMLVEAARSLLELSHATSTEFNPKTIDPIISLLEEQEGVSEKGGTMRLGEYPCDIVPGTQAYAAYKNSTVLERHRHRYEFNNVYRARLEQAGVVFSGVYTALNLVEIAEIKNHKFMVGTQFHPEFKSTYLHSHPLFARFIQIVKEGLVGT